MPPGFCFLNEGRPDYMRAQFGSVPYRVPGFMLKVSKNSGAV
jgi:hypothetical protein